MKFDLRRITRTCWRPKCNKMAEVELYNDKETHYGDFCFPHGKEARDRNTKRVQEEEKANGE